MPSTGSTKVAAALGFFALLLFLFVQPMAATPSRPRIRVLILDAFSNHDWHLTTALLRGILEAPGAVHSFGFDGSIHHRVSGLGTVASEL
jgi:hypothetical protein